MFVAWRSTTRGSKSDEVGVCYVGAIGAGWRVRWRSWRGCACVSCDGCVGRFILAGSCSRGASVWCMVARRGCVAFLVLQTPNRNTYVAKSNDGSAPFARLTIRGTRAIYTYSVDSYARCSSRAHRKLPRGRCTETLRSTLKKSSTDMCPSAHRWVH